MTYDEALAIFKTQANLAAALGITQSTISATWGTGDRDNRTFRVPAKYQFQLEVITSGALRADDDLRRPYVVPLPQQAAQQGGGGSRRQMGG